MSATTIHTFGKKQKPEGDVRARLRAHIMAGGASKQFSMSEGWHPTTAGKMLENMKIKKVFITEEEHAFLLKRRKESAS